MTGPDIAFEDVLRTLRREPFCMTKADIMSHTWWEIVNCILKPPDTERESGKFRTPKHKGQHIPPGIAGYKVAWDWAYRHKQTTDAETGLLRPFNDAELKELWAKKVEQLTARGKFGLGKKKRPRMLTKREMREARDKRKAERNGK